MLAAVSGGPDSVALLDALVSLAPAFGLRVIAAHLDHGLRESSGEHAAFCAEACRQRGVPLHLGRADVRGRAARDGCGVEEAAREERYQFLRRLRHETGAAVIALAHTRDDQAETFLLRLLRGAARTGLLAMRPRRDELWRPLLSVSREQVLAHLRARSLSFREDETNRELGLARNRVRHELIPYLESHFNPRLREALARSSEVLGAEAELLDSLAAELAPRMQGADAVLDLDRLNAAPLALRRLALRRALEQAGGLRGVKAVHLERLRQLAARGASGRCLELPHRRRAQVSFGELRLGPRRETPGDYVLPLAVPGSAKLPGGKVVVAREVAGPDGGQAVAAPSGPLVVRTRRPGDRVLSGARELSLNRFLMTRRVPLEERSRLPLVAAGRRVLWVCGQSLEPPAGAERFVCLQLLESA